MANRGCRPRRNYASGVARHGIASRLESSLRDFVFDGLASAGLSTDDLASHSTRRLLITYLAAARRRVPARPRTAHVSEAVERRTKDLGEEARRAVGQIRSDIESGRPLWPYMTTRIGMLDTPKEQRPPTLKGRHDVDLMLSAWGIHHLHLSTALMRKGHVRRTKELLFAVFHSNDAYLVDIGDHTSFHRTKVLEVIARTWPDAGILLRSDYVAGLSQSYDENESMHLREHGFSIVGEMIDGALWTPATVGMTMGGYSLTDVDLANLVLWSVENLAEQLRLDHQHLEKQFGSEVVFPAETNWRFATGKGGYGFYESSADAFYVLDDIELPTL